MAKNTEIDTKQLVDNVIEGIQEKKGSNIMLLDLRGIENVITNYFVICEGESNTSPDFGLKNVKKCYTTVYQ
jgi:ribosome-associated protein